MIVVRIPNGKFELSWIKGTWRDGAGHVWTFVERGGAFTNPRHGMAKLNEWRATEEDENE